MKLEITCRLCGYRRLVDVGDDPLEWIEANGVPTHCGAECELAVASGGRMR